MGATSVVNSISVNRKFPDETKDRKKYFLFGVFFDGTGNDMTNNHHVLADSQRPSVNLNDKKKTEEVCKVPLSPQINNKKSLEKYIKYKEENFKLDDFYSNKDGDDANDYSNVALLHHCFQGMSDDEISTLLADNYDVHIYNIYIEGPGTTGGIDNFIGTVFGRGSGGVLALLSQAADRINTILSGFGDLSKAEFHFDVFGFSRGATLARMFSTTVLDDDCPEVLLNDDTKKLREKVKRTAATVDFLGLFDTVSSIGIGVNDVGKYGLYLHDNVKGAMHLCASDEFRLNFAVTDLGDSVNKNSISEFYIPGCHTDVGGTYKTNIRTLKIEYMKLLPQPQPVMMDSAPLMYVNMEDLRLPLKMFAHEPNSRNNEEDISVELLSNLGWFSRANNNMLTDNGFIYEIHRLVRQGYNLLPFTLIAERAKIITKRKIFRSFESGYSRFDMNGNVARLTSDIKRKIERTMKGRHFVYPQGSYISGNYRELRENYINYSANSSPFDLVNPPSFSGATMCRIVVDGNKESRGDFFMCDYQTRG